MWKNGMYVQRKRFKKWETGTERERESARQTQRKHITHRHSEWEREGERVGEKNKKFDLRMKWNEIKL